MIVIGTYLATIHVSTYLMNKAYCSRLDGMAVAFENEDEPT